MNTNTKWLKSFARRSTLTQDTKDAFNTYAIPNCPSKIKEIFNTSKVILDIGFGYGESIITQALNNPNHLIIGCEPYLKGVSNLLKLLNTYQITNLLIWSDDARLLLDHIPDYSIQKVTILFPDPWPKRSHYKRRLINTNFLQYIVNKIHPSGELLIATDHQNYFEWIINGLQNSKNFSFKVTNNPTDFRTKYQKKALNKASQIYFITCIPKKI